MRSYTLMIRIFILILTLFLNSKAYTQKTTSNYTTNSNLDFTEFLNGVKYAFILVNDEFVTNVNNYPYGGNAKAISGIIKYLTEIGFSEVLWGSQLYFPDNTETLCDIAVIYPTWEYNDSRYTNIRLKFTSCNNDTYEFKIDKSIWNNGYLDVRSAFYENCLKFYNQKKQYNERYKLAMNSEMSEWNETKLKQYFTSKKTSSIEGIYESIIETSSMPKYKIGVIKSNDSLNIIYLSGARNALDWKEGEIKGILTPTANEYFFKTEWRMGDKQKNNDAYTSFEGNIFKLFLNGKESSSFLKLYPTSKNQKSENNKTNTTGTGFAISSNGLIVTNSHVINGSNTIFVKGIKGDFSKRYRAEVIIDDKNNDLCIIEIKDSTFKGLGSVPYSIKSSSTDVGESVFVLGYPMKAIMGDEIKLTNGIISSKTGFQGDVTSYQISVPLQPGNSGGPLFDSKGNVIGIVNSKLAIGENVSYAIKANYLLNLIELLPKKPSTQVPNNLASKSLPDKTKIIRNYVYTIEVE